MPRFRRKLIQASAAVLAVGLSLPAEAQDLITIDAISSNDASCSVYPQHVARLLGINADEGVDVTLLSSATTVPYTAFLENGDADFVMLDAAQVLQMASAGVQASVVYITHHFAPEGIVVVADSPILSLTDLKGTTIGLASDRDRTTTAIALDSVGLSIDDVSTAVIGDSGPVMANALVSGQVSAFAGGGSDRAGIEAAGVQIRNITPPEVSNTPGNTWAMSNGRKTELRAAASGFFKAWAMAQHAGVVDTKAVISVCRDAIPEQFENMATGEKLINNSVYTTQLRRTRDYGELQYDAWERMQPPLIKLGELADYIHPSSFLDPQFIPAANAWVTQDVKNYIQAWKAANPDKIVP